MHIYNVTVKCNLSSGLASRTRARVIHGLIFGCFHSITTALHVTLVLLLLLLLLLVVVVVVTAAKQYELSPS
jgi:hypothetical protein